MKQEYESIPENNTLKRRIDYIIERIKENPSFGQPIRKELIPKEYRNKEMNNAFWTSLSKEGRLIYSLKSLSEFEVIVIILEWFTRHKDYERRFGY